MKFSEQSIKPCGDLMEVILFVPQGEGTQDFLLGAETRFGTMTVYADDLEQHIEFGVSSATLRLILHGCRIAPGTRLGDEHRPKPVRTTVQQQTVRKARASREVNISATTSAHAGSTGGAVSVMGRAGGQIGGGSSSEHKEVSKTAFEITQAPIVAESGNRWVFHALNEQVLLARRSGDEHLCKVELTSESVIITAQFYFFPKHIVLFEGELAGGSPLFRKLRQSRAKAAIAKTLLARQLRDREAWDNLAGAVLGAIFRLQSVLDS